MYEALTPEEDERISNGTVTGSDLAAIAKRLGKDRLQVVNAVVVYECSVRLQAAADARGVAIAGLSASDRAVVGQRVRQRARKLLVESWAEEGVVPLLAHPMRRVFMDKQRAQMSDMVFLPQGRKNAKVRRAGVCPPRPLARRSTPYCPRRTSSADWPGSS